MLSTIYKGWRILIIWWGWWLLVSNFWRMIHARRLWEDGSKIEKTWWRSSSTSGHLIGNFVAAMRVTTTTTSGMHCNQLRINGWRISGIVEYLLSFWPSQSLMHFWFYATLSTVGYVRRECLSYWSFVRSWHGNLLTIYTLGNGVGGVSSCRTPFFDWWLHQGTR